MTRWSPKPGLTHYPQVPGREVSANRGNGMDAMNQYQLLGRLLVYLEACGLELDAATFDTALKMLSDLQQSASPPEDFDWLLERIPHYFRIAGGALPRVAPPFQRGSIGYYAHGSS